MMDSVSWVCEGALGDHEWVTEIHVTLKENEILTVLNYDDVSCVIQWGLLWFSSPSRLNQRFANKGATLAKYHGAVNVAIEATFSVLFDGVHTPRTCLLGSVSVVLHRSPDKDWNFEKEMKGWGLGEWLCLPPHDNDWDDDISDA